MNRVNRLNKASKESGVNNSHLRGRSGYMAPNVVPVLCVARQSGGVADKLHPPYNDYTPPHDNKGELYHR